MERIGGVAAALAEISQALEVLEGGGGQSGVGARLGGSVEKIAGDSYWRASVKLKRNVLDELVTAQLLRLDGIPSEGDAAIRAARKAQVHAALALGERVKALLPPENAIPSRAEEESATVSALRSALAAERAKSAQQAERLAHLEGARSDASPLASLAGAVARVAPAAAALPAAPPAAAVEADAAAGRRNPAAAADAPPAEAPAEAAAPIAAIDPLSAPSDAPAAVSAGDAAVAAALAEADAERW